MADHNHLLSDDILHKCSACGIMIHCIYCPHDQGWLCPWLNDDEDTMCGPCLEETWPDEEID